MKVCEKIRKIREENNLTQEEFAGKINISVAALKNYENEDLDRKPKNDILMEISKKFGVSIDYLLRDEIEIKHYNDIKIGQELGLTNDTIEILRGISNTHNINLKVESINLSKTMDMFFQSVDFQELLVHIEVLQWLSEMYYSMINPLVELVFKQQKIIDYVVNKDTDKLKYFYENSEKLLKSLENFIIDFYQLTIFYNSEKVPYLKCKKYLKEFKKAVSQDNTKEYEKQLSEYHTCICDIATQISGDIEIQKYKINKIIMFFTEKIENKESVKWGNIYGSTRNRKK